MLTYGSLTEKAAKQKQLGEFISLYHLIGYWLNIKNK